jgi:hypothetical protein
MYALSFFLPAFGVGVESQLDANNGFEAFAVSFLACVNPFFGGLNAFVPWLGNPMFWVAVWFFAIGRCRRACLAGALATVMSATLWLFADSESRHLLFIGYYVWLLSMAMLTVAAAIKWAGEIQVESRASNQSAIGTNGHAISRCQFQHAFSKSIPFEQPGRKP